MQIFAQVTKSTRHRALADILHSALCCHNDETGAQVANPPNSAQLEGTPTVPPRYVWIRAVVWECGDRQRDTQARVTNIHFASSTTPTACN